jgi:large conductance mechanosensitive channel
MLKEFTEFLKQYNVIGLAIAIIIGGKLNQLASSLVNDFITPLILNPVLNALSIEKIAELSWKGVFYGNLLSSIIDFLIVAFVVFLLIKWVNRMAKVTSKTENKK